MITPLNCCIFRGQLVGFKLKEDPLASWKLGTVFLLLPESEGSSLGQKITLKCWNNLADRLSEVPMNMWIKVISNYSVESFKGKSYPVFEITSFSVETLVSE